MRKQVLTSLAGLAAFGLTGCEPYEYGTPGYGVATGPVVYQGTQWAGPPRQPWQGDLQGPGLDILDPWLRETAEGRAVVTLGFNTAAEGVVSEDVAHRANIWFRRYADHNCDMQVTDPEIRTALVSAARAYLR